MILRVFLVSVAVCVAIVPIPAAGVERVYSMDLYPRLQALVTTVTNRVPIALLDVGCAALLLGAILVVRRAARMPWRQAVLSLTASAAVTGSLLYLIFLVAWGLNYRRVPLEDKLVFDTARVTPQAAFDLANGASLRLNRSYQAAHAVAPDAAALERTFAGVQRAIGASRPAVVGVPKRSLLTPYFRRAAIDGMTDPFFLEIIVNPDVLPFERPFVVTHEWAHLAGYATESEANFVAWLTCLRGDALSQYSGWIATYHHAAGALSRDERSKLAALDPGPREDLRAIAARYQRSSPAIREAARDVYDGYLRANRVPEGIGSYDAVLRLMLGGRFDERWTPQLRPR